MHVQYKGRKSRFKFIFDCFHSDLLIQFAFAYMYMYVSAVAYYMYMYVHVQCTFVVNSLDFLLIFSSLCVIIMTMGRLKP